MGKHMTDLPPQSSCQHSSCLCVDSFPDHLFLPIYYLIMLSSSQITQC